MNCVAVPTPVNEKLVELIKSESAVGADGSTGAGRTAVKYSGGELAEAVGVVVPFDYGSWAIAAALLAICYRLFV